ncbi:MAG: carbohydrate kinase family protein [Spirochaetaceae bacterium]|nr:carbohydrate kinase family protein [Spirochaetaceae bacterium]MDT8296963.1 carbohydrate kinase family protein [Spirochaetaceae bacterium]
MIRVNATGCSLVDNLFGEVSFSIDAYERYKSRTVGDGGLATGGLVFSEALAGFAGKDYIHILKELTGKERPDRSNIGGPGIVPIIHANQVKGDAGIQYRFAGVVGRDENGKRFRELLTRAGFSDEDYTETSLPTPSTDVLSDPSYNNGRGERTFINTIGAADAYGPDALPDNFFDAEMILFGATALVPPLHDALDELAARGRNSGAFVMVCTVFDFRNEARLKGKPWPLVQNYANIDLLVVDKEESVKISGAPTVSEAMEWFLNNGCGSVVITQGADDVLLGIGSTGKKRPWEFKRLKRRSMPTCRYADEITASMTTPRDTTGCGDNFVGGMMDSIARQLAEAPSMTGRMSLDLEDAVFSGIAAGSVALTCLGGVYYEKAPGQKLEALDPYLTAYRKQLEESL